ncbi:MAG: hypothetical protein QGG74_02915 [Phycisphaerales bacterium]|nr:hypothetical protein [Phycisphaerales bacterium]
MLDTHQTGLTPLSERFSAELMCGQHSAAELMGVQHSAGTLNIPIGTMIEILRAAVVPDDIAEVAEFFSSGTNDLAQLTLRYSRGDVNGFLPDYLHRGILENAPFQSIDVDGVGALVDVGCRNGRVTKSNLKLGVYGEHGGDPASVDFFEGFGLDYVSCSPFRVPTARLAAAQAVIRRG